MQNENQLNQWVKQKLEEGVEKQRLKKILREAGHDPNIVDEVDNPFSGADQQSDSAETGFHSSDQENSHRDSASESQRPDYKYTQSNEETAVAEDNDSGSILPSFSMPSLELSLPNVPFNWKHLGLIVLLVGLIAGGIYGFNSMNNSNTPDTITTGDQECPNVGVRIRNVTVEDSRSLVWVEVTNGEAQVILNSYQNNRRMDSITRTIGGNTLIEMESTGNRFEFYPKGCTRYRDTVSVG